jgi:ABC-type branched-subunit amino acid transport system ATPase component
LQVRNVSRSFRTTLAVDDVSFDVQPGDLLGLIGPNGAGKSTLINMLSGFYLPSAGRIFLDAEPLHGRSAYAHARAGIARSYQTSRLFGSLSVIDNVALAAPRGDLGALLSASRMRSPQARARAAGLLRWCGFAGRLEQAASGLAHVDRRLVEIARALAGDPEVLLLDEPGAGLAREDKERLALLLRRIAGTGIGVVLVEHDMALVMDISDHVIVIDAGVFLACGSPAEVQNNPVVRKAYLGEPGGAAALGGAASRQAPDEAPPALEVTGLTTGYGAEPVLHAIDLVLRTGHTVALLGANGAGKTTLMRSLIGLHRPLRGTIRLFGDEISAQRTEQIVSLGLILVPEGRQVFPELSVLDNLRLGAFLKTSGSDGQVAAMLTRFPSLHARLHQRAGLLSGGEQQMLAIARALMAKPRVLILDEPSLGLAPKAIQDLFEALRQLRDEGLTLVVVDQMAALALALADGAYICESGRIVAHGTSRQIAANPGLAKAYLGAH